MTQRHCDVFLGWPSRPKRIEWKLHGKLNLGEEVFNKSILSYGENWIRQAERNAMKTENVRKIDGQTDTQRINHTQQIRQTAHKQAHWL